MTRQSTYTSQGIRIEVVPQYESEYSDISLDRHLHSYQVKIYNERPTSCQLISRQWEVWDSRGTTKIVKGEGVIGEQPIIESGKKYMYSSWCPMKSTIGRMRGHYVMKDLDTGETFIAPIPEFHLVTDYIQN